MLVLGGGVERTPLFEPHFLRISLNCNESPFFERIGLNCSIFLKTPLNSGLIVYARFVFMKFISPDILVPSCCKLLLLVSITQMFQIKFIYTVHGHALTQTSITRIGRPIMGRSVGLSVSVWTYYCKYICFVKYHT